MHLVLPDRRGRRIIEDDRVCNAIGAIGHPERIDLLAQRFSLLADPTRLTLLVCIQAAGPISVSDLAAAADLNDTTVSQALRLLKHTGAVRSRRQGHVVRYEINDPEISTLLTGIGAVKRVARRHSHARTAGRTATGS